MIQAEAVELLDREIAALKAEVPHADLAGTIARLERDMAVPGAFGIKYDAFDDIRALIAALGDTVPREEYDMMVRRGDGYKRAHDERTAERDALARVVEQARMVGTRLDTVKADVLNALQPYNTAPAVSLALHDAEVKAQALDEFATFISGSRADGLSGWTIAQVRMEAKHRADAIREDTIKEDK